MSERETIVDVLEDVAWRRSEVARLREAAFQDEQKAHQKRAKADALELDVVEALTAANILREAGLRVDRDERGDPRVSVERGFAPRDPAK